MSETGRLRFALAGLQAGVLGAALMLGTYLAAGAAGRRPLWLVPNLLASTFHGANNYSAGFTVSTMTGVAFLFLLYGVLGAAWGLFWGDREVRHLWLGGAVAGYLVYQVFATLIWKWANPFFALYAPEMQLRTGHVLWGLMLGQTPRYAANIRRALSPAPEPSGSAVIE